MRIESVPLEVRYLGAWSEISTRIAQRQNSLSIYFVSANIVLGFLLTRLKVGEINPDIKLFDMLVTLILPMSALIFAILSMKHDETITLLRVFLQYCERARSHCDLSSPAVLGYNDDHFYHHEAVKFSRIHDFVFALTVAFISMPVFLWVIYNARSGNIYRESSFLVDFVYTPLYLLLFLTAMWCVLKKPKYEKDRHIEYL